MADQREILEKVAAGELSPEEAASLLDAAEDDANAAPTRPRAKATVIVGGRPVFDEAREELREARRHLREEIRRDVRDARRDARQEARDAQRDAREALRDVERELGRRGWVRSFSVTDESGDAPRSEPLFPDVDIDALRIVGAFRKALIVGDPSVRTVSVQGPHAARVEGTTLIINSDDPEAEGFRFETRRGGSRRSFRVGVDDPHPVPLTVYANPALALEAQVAAGTLRIVEMHGPVHAEVAAGAMSVLGATGELDLSTAAGPIKVQGKITTGAHKIRCEAGAVKVILSPESDVTINARASLGKVMLPGSKAPSGFSIGNSQADATIGNGTATLSIECAVGGVKVVVDEDGDAA